MISEIGFSSIASIKPAKLNFSPYLNVIIGETGTGKTLFLSLFKLLKGEKPSFPIKENSFVEALFKEDNEETYIRREMMPHNSRYFLNGMRTTQKVVYETLSPLIAFQSQRLSVCLLKPSYQLKVLDSFSGDKNLILDYSKLFTRLKKLKAELDELKLKNTRRNDEIEFLKFQINEIESIKLKENEEERLLELRERIGKTESIKNFLGLSKSRLYDSDSSAFSQISRVISELEKLNVKTHILGRLSTIQDELESIVADIEGEFGNIEVGSSINDVESRLYEIDKLKGKYGGTYESIMDHLRNSRERLSELENLDEKVREKEIDVKNVEKMLLDISEKLTRTRRKHAKLLEERVLRNLRDMYLTNARFSIKFRKMKEFGPNGTETIEFLFSGNPKFPLSPLSKAISGGELSRFLISLFDVMVDTRSTMVFDEIDAGMSGKVLSSVAEKLRKVSRKNQIIAVTHSPQVAAMADKIFKVEKSPSNMITIRQLNENEVEGEIATMISGKRTNGSLQAAKELLERK